MHHPTVTNADFFFHLFPFSDNSLDGFSCLWHVEPDLTTEHTLKKLNVVNKLHSLSGSYLILSTAVLPMLLQFLYILKCRDGIWIVTANTFRKRQQWSNQAYICFYHKSHSLRTTLKLYTTESERA